MPTTRYFAEQVLRKRPYLSLEMCESVVRESVRTEIQPDGRVRHWGRVTLPGEEKARILRAVTLDDGTTSNLSRGSPMKLHYYAETDSLYIEFSEGAGVETREVIDGVNVDVGADGTVVGIDIDGASRKLDLATLETQGLPIGRLKAA